MKRRPYLYFLSHLAILFLATVYIIITEMIYALMVGGISTLHTYYIMCIEYEHKKGAGDLWNPCEISQRQCKLANADLQSSVRGHCKLSSSNR